MRSTAGRFKGRYDFFTIYLVPGTTVLLASLDSWTDTNLSVLGSASGHKLMFALWGFITGIYYCIYIQYLFHIGRYRNMYGKCLIYTAAVFLLTAVMIPYMPEQHPFKARLHVLLAFLAPILMAMGIVSFLRFLSRKDRPRFKTAWRFIGLMAAGALVMLLMAGFITSVLEVFLVVGMCGYLRYMERLLVSRR